jgi:4'-phosphopantetheinyl transferase
VRDVDVHYRRLGPEVGAELYDFLCADLLCAEERHCAAQFRFERDRRAFVLRRGFLRQTLADYLNLDPAAIKFTQNAFGKPRIASSGLYFSSSHSAGLAILAVSRTYEIGVDVERIDPSFDHHGIPEHFFSAEETRKLRSLPDLQQTEAFFRLWTSKEACVKARGRGLSLPLDRMEKGWSIESFEPESGYIAALACWTGWSA